jgi:hypothetical protein
MPIEKINLLAKSNVNGRPRATGEGRGKGGGRPQLAIDPKVVAGMAFVGATNIEIAEFVGCSADVIERHFASFTLRRENGCSAVQPALQLSPPPHKRLKTDTRLDAWLKTPTADR